MRLLAHYDIPVPGRRVAVVGRSVIVGRPMAMLLNRKGEGANATVTLCHPVTKPSEAPRIPPAIVPTTGAMNVPIPAPIRAYFPAFLKADFIEPSVFPRSA